jgi:hypothetical protein
MGNGGWGMEQMANWRTFYQKIFKNAKEYDAAVGGFSSYVFNCEDTLSLRMSNQFYSNAHSVSTPVP